MSRALRNSYIKNWSYCIVAWLLLVYSVVVLVFGDNLIVPIHDNLDAGVAWMKMLKDYNLFWNNDGIVSMLGGLSRHYFPSQLKAYTWLYLLFPAFYAYAFGLFSSVVIAVSSGVYLGRSILNNEWHQYNHIVVFFVLAFMVTGCIEMR